MSELTENFPNIIPMEEIRVGPESHTYQVIEYDSGPNASKSEYIPNKAPVLEVETVSGYVDGDAYTFQQGTDYEIIDNDNDGRLETIDFSIGGESPDANTEFEITYISKSVILRLLNSYDNELDRLGKDIETVISSHYVDEATNTGFIDTFEDEEIVEYATDYCVGTVGVQTTVVYQGDWALRMQNECNTDPLTVTSTTGLRRYPKRGDEFVYYMQLTNDGDIGHLDFMYEGEPNERYYSVRLNSESDNLVLQKNSGAVKKDETNVDLGAQLGTWLEAEVTVDQVGDITVTLSVASSGTELATATIVDTEYSSGGIRWRAFNGSGTGVVYADAAEVTSRKSSDLDRIGALFGDLGRRRGRSDEDYKTFLRSIVQSFSGRGTVQGIKFAVASGLGISTDQLDILEDFQNNEYVVRLEKPFPAHRVVTITDLAELADPSGVEFDLIEYFVADELVDASDDVSVLTGNTTTEVVESDDTAQVNPNLTTIAEETKIGDTVLANPDLTTIGEVVDATDTTDVNPDLTTTDEETTVADTTVVNPNKTTVAEDTSTDDTVTPKETKVAWNQGSWNDMDWATEHN